MEGRRNYRRQLRSSSHGGYTPDEGGWGTASPWIIHLGSERLQVFDRRTKNEVSQPQDLKNLENMIFL